MVVSGINTIRQLLITNSKIEKVIIGKNFSSSEKGFFLDTIQSKNIPIEWTDNIDKICKDKKHQDIIAFIPQYSFHSLEDILKNKTENVFFVILDKVVDPHNLGSIIRTCECAGVDCIIIPKNRACPINETVYKTSSGAICTMPVAQVTNLNDCIRTMKEKNIWIYGMESGGNNIYSTNLKGNIALVVGSEGYGISLLTAKLCDDIISLPMLGKVNSLNASNAAAIGIYEILRQRS